MTTPDNTLLIRVRETGAARTRTALQGVSGGIRSVAGQARGAFGPLLGLNLLSGIAAGGLLAMALSTGASSNAMVGLQSAVGDLLAPLGAALDLFLRWFTLLGPLTQALIISGLVLATIGRRIILGLLVGALGKAMAGFKGLAAVIGIPALALLGWVIIIALVVAAFTFLFYFLFTRFASFRRATAEVINNFLAYMEEAANGGLQLASVIHGVGLVIVEVFQAAANWGMTLASVIHGVGLVIVEVFQAAANGGLLFIETVINGTAFLVADMKHAAALIANALVSGFEMAINAALKVISVVNGIGAAIQALGRLEDPLAAFRAGLRADTGRIELPRFEVPARRGAPLVSLPRFDVASPGEAFGNRFRPSFFDVASPGEAFGNRFRPGQVNWPRLNIPEESDWYRQPGDGLWNLTPAERGFVQNIYNFFGNTTEDILKETQTGAGEPPFNSHEQGLP